MEGLKIIPAKAGCEGCFFADKESCPADDPNNPLKPNITNCSVDSETAGIFVPADEL